MTLNVQERRFHRQKTKYFRIFSGNMAHYYMGHLANIGLYNGHVYYLADIDNYKSVGIWKIISVTTFLRLKTD